MLDLTLTARSSFEVDRPYTKKKGPRSAGKFEGQQPVSAVLRIWLPNDGGRRNPTLASFLTNGRFTLELTSQSSFYGFSMDGNGRTARHLARMAASSSRESEHRARCGQSASKKADGHGFRQPARNVRLRMAAFSPPSASYVRTRYRAARFKRNNERIPISSDPSPTIGSRIAWNSKHISRTSIG